MMMHWYGGTSAWGFGAMAASMALFWILVIGGTVLLVRWIGTDRRPVVAPRPDPRTLLAERFARGEIDETEYRQRLTALGG